MAQKRKLVGQASVHSMLSDAVTAKVGESALFCSYIAMVAVLTVTIHTVESVTGLV